MKNVWALTDGKKNYSINEKIWIGEDLDILNIKSPFDKNFLFRINILKVCCVYKFQYSVIVVLLRFY